MSNTAVDTASRPADVPIEWPWMDRFAGLGEAFFTRLDATGLPAPVWVGRHDDLARELGLPLGWWGSEDALGALAGNQRLPGSHPLASVYSGHQFGHWAGQLGDGRALWLGELSTPLGPMELQLKGAGRTPYSRMGDGRAVLRSSIREFLASEAMHGLGIPTSRALAVVGSPQPVVRETVETAAVVTRVAPSFIRFGHFEHFAAANRLEELRRLADFVIDNHLPACRETGGNPYASLLAEVTRRTAQLIARWQAVGFCHGVMNTDNMSILGLTIDYGPFQFMDAFDPAHVCNHSDTGGRYAYHRQPNVAYWNLFCLGQALLPLLDDQQQALDALEPYKTAFPAALQRAMGAKLGLHAVSEGDDALIDDLMRLMAADRVDFTIAFRRLGDSIASGGPARDLFLQRDAFDAWHARWRQRLQTEPDFSPEATRLAMHRTNPRIVLRNHLAEIAIRRARDGDFSEVDRLLKAFAAPFDERPDEDDLAAFPPDWAAGLEISCSS